MPTITTAAPVGEAKVCAVVLRCGCGNPESHAGAVCPQAVRVNLGTIAYWHRNPLRRLLYRVGRIFSTQRG